MSPSAPRPLAFGLGLALMMTAILTFLHAHMHVPDVTAHPDVNVPSSRAAADAAALGQLAQLESVAAELAKDLASTQALLSERRAARSWR